jgi:hypothetical protein
MSQQCLCPLRSELAIIIIKHCVFTSRKTNFIYIDCEINSTKVFVIIALFFRTNGR